MRNSLVLVMLAVAAPALADDDDGHIEHAKVNGPGIAIEMSWMTMTGTTHVAEALAITTARGTLQLGDGGLPLVERVLAVDARHWLVLGWSSFGEGMQSEHAWLVEDLGVGPVVADSLTWTTDRAHAGLAVAAFTRPVVGIPLPARRDGLHDEGDWNLRHGADELALADVEKLPADRANVKSLPGHYTPPFDTAPAQRGWSGRFVWFEISGDKLALRHHTPGTSR